MVITIMMIIIIIIPMTIIINVKSIKCCCMDLDRAAQLRDRAKVIIIDVTNIFTDIFTNIIIVMIMISFSSVDGNGASPWIVSNPVSLLHLRMSER